MKRFFSMALTLTLVGCASSPTYQGHGEFFTLKHRNVVYRDLTVPLQVGNDNEKATYSTLPAAIE